jgi:hypothetical protein
LAVLYILSAKTLLWQRFFSGRPTLSLSPWRFAMKLDVVNDAH